MIEVKELEPMKIIRYLLIISALILTACQTSTSDKDSFNLSDFKAIKGSRILANAEILNPQNIVTIDSGILLADYHAPYLLQYYKNYNDTNPQCIAEKGSGPSEFINVRNLYYSPDTKKLFIYDSQLKRITTYNVGNGCIVTDTACTRRISIRHINGYETMPLNNDYITTGVFSGKPFARINQDGSMFKDFGTFPVDSAEINDPIAFHLMYQSRIIANPEGTRMVSASPLSDWLAFYDMGGSTPKLVKEYYSYAPKLITKQSDANTTSVMLDDDCMSTYTHLTSTENYVYALYDGRTQKEIQDNIFQSKYILKFNWDGELVDGFRVDEKIYCFSVVNDDSKMLGVVDGGENMGEDNIVIKEYRLD